VPTKNQLLQCQREEANDTNDAWACPACVNPSENKERADLETSQKRVGESLWNLTWVPEELQNTHKFKTQPSKVRREYQPTERETPTSPMISNFGTKSILTSIPPTLKQTL
jgi:hypothetical protein